MTSANAIIDMVLGPVASFVMEHPREVIALIVAIGGGGFHYRKTGRLPRGKLILDALKDIWGELADQYGSVERPKGVPALLVTGGHDELEQLARANFFESVDDYSYEYEGEVLNLRRGNGIFTHPRTGEQIPMELHFRTFGIDAEGKVLVLAHHEASRYEDWGDHYAETVMSWDRGQQMMAELLEEFDIPVEQIESERAADIVVTS